MNQDTSPLESPPALPPPTDEPPPPPPTDEAPRAGQPGASRFGSLLAFGLTLVGAAALMFAAHRYASRQAPTTGGTPGQAQGVGLSAPDFMLKDIQGNTFRMADLKGKVVIVDFWATWCAPCKVEIPWFIEMYDRYRAQGLEVVGVAMDEEGVDVVKPFAEEFKMNYRVVLGNEAVATQFGGIYGLPTTFIIGRDGKIHDKHVGLVSRETFEEAVKKLL